MAIYTTLFLCKPEELLTGFPGWKLPLAQPVRREFRNPFTGKLSVVESRKPEWPDDADEEPEREYGVVSIKGNYKDYLEDRLPEFVRSCPHWAAKGLTCVELKPLLEAMGAPGSMDSPIYGPPSSGAFIEQFPPNFIAKLVSLDQNTVAAQWAAIMSAPEHTHSVSGEKLSDGWKATEALQLLQHILELARNGTAGQRMYLLTEA